MNDFLTEKNKKTGVLGKLKWVLCGFCILFTLGAIGAAEKYIGEGRCGMAATEIILGLLFLYPTFREIQKALKKKKARENIAGNYSASLLTKEIRGLREATVEMEVSLKFRKEKENRYYVFPFMVYFWQR